MMAIHDLRQIIAFASSFRRDRDNEKIFGASAPKTAELLWVDPQSVDFYLTDLPKGLTPRTTSGRLVDFRRLGLRLVPIDDRPQITSSVMHWRDGVPWEQTPDFRKRMTKVKLLRAGLRRNTKSAIVRRYRRLDELYETIARERAFKTQKQLKRWNFREYGGVQICIDATGRLALMRASGLHRIAIAKLLALPFIPAMVGVVDVGAVAHLELLRRPPEARNHVEHCAPAKISAFNAA